MLKWWRRLAKAIGTSLVCLVFLSSSASAFDSSTYNILANPFYDPSGTSDCSEVSPPPSTPNGPSKVDLNSVVQPYKLQSVMVKKIGGQEIASYQSSQPPKTVASVFKLIIADTLLSQNPDLNKKITITANEVYSGSGRGGQYTEDPKAGDQMTLKTALQMTLMKSSDTDANALIDAAGGLSAANAAAHKLGYGSSAINNYYHDPPSTPYNATTVADLTRAMENIFSNNSDNYQIAQQALEHDQYTFGLGSVANKWGGTSSVTGNSAIFAIGDSRYIITLYTENPWSDSIPAQGISEATSASVGYIRDATNQIINQLKGVGSIPAQPAGVLSTCQSVCTSGSSSSLDRFLQVVAIHEGYNAGDYQAHNPAGAYGRYQYIPTTWQGAVKSYYPVGADKYPLASDPPTPGDVQDMVTYFRFAAMDAKFNGSAFKMAVEQYWPAANIDPSQLDIVPHPEAGNTLTVRQYANNIINDINGGKGSQVTLRYKDNPDFNAYLQQNGLANVPELVASVNGTGSGQPPQDSGNTSGYSCAGAAAIVQTAINLSWPDASHGTTPKQEYKDAIDKYNAGEPAADCGVFVATVMRASGADSGYPAVGTSNQADYVMHSSRYDVKSGITSTSELQPGDILILAGQNGDAASGHTFIYLGQVPGTTNNEASASYQERAANLGVAWLSDPRGLYMRARLIQ